MQSAMLSQNISPQQPLEPSKAGSQQQQRQLRAVNRAWARQADGQHTVPEASEASCKQSLAHNISGVNGRSPRGGSGGLRENTTGVFPEMPRHVPPKNGCKTEGQALPFHELQEPGESTAPPLSNVSEVDRCSRHVARGRTSPVAGTDWFPGEDSPHRASTLRLGRAEPSARPRRLTSQPSLLPNPDEEWQRTSNPSSLVTDNGSGVGPRELEGERRQSARPVRRGVFTPDGMILKFGR